MAISRPVLLALACLGLFVLSPIAMVASQSAMSVQQFDDDIGIHRAPRYALDVTGDVAWDGTLLEGDVPFSRLVGAPRFQVGDGLAITGGVLADPYVVGLDTTGLVGCGPGTVVVWDDVSKHLKCVAGGIPPGPANTVFSSDGSVASFTQVTGAMVSDGSLSDIDISNAWSAQQDFAAGLRITTHAGCLDNPLDRFGGTSPGEGNRAPCNASSYPSSTNVCGGASEVMLGEIKLFPYNFAPAGFAHAAGQLLPINQYQALFSLLGTQYGGNGQTNFALPDLRGLGPSGMSYVIAMNGIYPSRC